MRIILYEGVEIETCPGCEGEWLDAGELLKITTLWETKFTPEEMKEIDAVNRNIFKTHDESSELSCPKCDATELRRRNYAVSSGVAIDRCLACEGVWLDHQELEKVQILAEHWELKLSEDLGEQGELLEKIRQQHEEWIDEQVSISRFGIVNWILRAVF